MAASARLCYSRAMPESPPKNLPPRGLSRRRFLLGAGAAFAGGIFGDALLREPHALQVRDVSLRLTKIPPGRELRLVQISDLHIRAFADYHREVAETVNALAQGPVLITGDFLERSRNLKDVLRFLDHLEAPQGVFAIQGNWEYWARVEGESLRRHFARHGARLLINERHDLLLDEVPLSILGLDFPSREGELAALREKADPGRLNLLLSHVPGFDHRHLDGRVDLVLCGHTHGGQVRLPFLPPVYLPRYSGRFVEGLYRVGTAATPLYVNRGIGTTVLPVRFLCRPEITVLRLQAAPV